MKAAIVAIIVKIRSDSELKMVFRKIKDNAGIIFTSLWSYRIIRFGLSAIFIYAGIIKLFDPKGFARIISSYDIVPEALLPIVAIGLPLLETVAGIGLLLEIRGSLAVISFLLGLFVCILGYGILNDLSVDCGCFGTEELAQQNALRYAFYRDLFLAGIILPYLYLSRWSRAHSILNHKTPGEESEDRAP
jgi:uncharacterized membrane protein YphA (DoxX/SURF4 family)